MKESFAELVKTVKRSRRECPWFKNSTMERCAKELLSEAHEVAEAVEKKDYENLKEELGDLIHDTLMLIDVAVEKGLFDEKDVLQEVDKKVKRRKPFIFGEARVVSAEEAAKIWNEIKQKEKDGKI